MLHKTIFTNIKCTNPDKNFYFCRNTCEFCLVNDKGKKEESCNWEMPANNYKLKHRG